MLLLLICQISVVAILLVIMFGTINLFKTNNSKTILLINIFIWGSFLVVILYGVDFLINHTWFDFFIALAWVYILFTWVRHLKLRKGTLYFEETIKSIFNERK